MSVSLFSRPDDIVKIADILWNIAAFLELSIA